MSASAPWPVDIFQPERQAGPLLAASPHSGRDYRLEFLDAVRLDEATLRRSEDSDVDVLFADAPGLGVPFLVASFPRAFCDVNREAWELDPGMFEDELPPWVNTTSPRVGAGLGTIARVVANGEAIYGVRLRFAEAERRVRALWEPYHTALARLIEATRQQFGAALLLDCHSMPAHATESRHPSPDIVLGDAHGAACAASVTRFAETFFAGLGYVVRRNDPYAGGYVTRHYGRPLTGVHVLQIELARRLYMNESTMARTAHFSTLRAQCRDFLASMAEQAPSLLA